MKEDDVIRLLEMDLSIHLMGSGYERRYLLGQINGIKIEIFPNEHTPPHFHISTPDFKASFTVDKCDLFKGEVNSATHKKIKEFHSKNRDRIIDEWNRLRPSNCPVGPITK